MQPEGHRAIVRAGAARAGALALLPELLRGNDDEDVHIVPLLGLRLQAAGLTHTHRPGSSRGELFAPSAGVCCVKWVERSRAAKSPAEGAYFLGRACHLLVDVAVPARSRGVWHFYGDPLESWVEEHVAEIGTMPVAKAPPYAGPAALADALARLSSSYPVDTTRSTWGSWAMRLTGRGRRVSPEEAGEQARALVPAAIAYVETLLRAELGDRAHAPR
jgi:hypothetical protein